MINGGIVGFERSVKVADYENKKAKVELSFGVEEGATKEAQENEIDRVLNLAKAKCELILGIATLSTRVTKAEGEAASKPAGRKPPAPPKEKEPAKEPEKVELPGNAGEVGAVGDDGLDELTGSAAPAEITDAQLIDKVKKANEVIQNPLAIRQLGAKVGELKALRSVIEVPQDKRPAFLEALAAMEAEAKAAKK